MNILAKSMKKGRLNHKSCPLEQFSWDGDWSIWDYQDRFCCD